MNTNDVQLTVMKIDKTKKERRHLWRDKCFYMAMCGMSILGGAILATTGLEFTFGLWGVAMAVKKFGYNSARSLASEKTEIIDGLKSTVTYEDYRDYHEPCEAVKMARKVKNKIKYGRRAGFAPSASATV